MKHLFAIAIGVICVLGLAGGAVAEEKAAAPAKKIEMKSCTLPGLPPESLCGTYEVWENRAARTGRKIPLRVVVIPALGTDKLSDPFVFFTGGPGDSSVEAGGWISQELKDLRQRRDIFLVDYRGTGGSNPLNCPELQGSQGVQGFLDDFLPVDKIRRCAEDLGKKFDLTQYTSDAAIDDIDEVRAALGYDRINLLGGSYGSRAALIYLRRHPSGCARRSSRAPSPRTSSARSAWRGAPRTPSMA
ncbi:MAG TPA: alpha/beta fold hydrolase [Thermoanaerobaculia bacterium]